VADTTPKPNTRVAHAKYLPMNMTVSSARFAFLSEVQIWKSSYEIPITAVAVSAMRRGAIGR
jgi:hypothetical protein